MALKSVIKNLVTAATGKAYVRESTPFPAKALLNALPYSEYAYGLYHAANLAKRLGLDRISALEYGVAGGNGLVAMERHAEVIQGLLGVSIDIYGFDTGVGLPGVEDYRDLPYAFKAGLYRMDVPKLKAKLKRATLILGEVKDTATNFLEEHKPAPIGFVSFDMDYYTPTAQALRMFTGDKNPDYFLPRIFMHLDDSVGSETTLYSEFTGELLAVKEFNDAEADVKIAPNRRFLKLPYNYPWYPESFVMHRLQHPQHNVFIGSSTAASNSLVADA